MLFCPCFEDSKSLNLEYKNIQKELYKYCDFIKVTALLMKVENNDKNNLENSDKTIHKSFIQFVNKSKSIDNESFSL